MLDRFRQYISEKNLFNFEDKILVAVSGGLDSVTLAHLCFQAKINFALAHCNFGLRAEESDDDEKFVKKLAIKYKVPFHVQHFDTKTFAQEEKISTQMAARQLRYEWFHTLLEKENYQYIATAHHSNDVLETVLLNLTKGTGISGLHGIRSKNEKVIRPLLFANKEDIMEYMAEEQLAFREDSSNTSNKYQRNLLRNEVIPLLKKINPNIENTIKQTVEKINAVENIFYAKVEELKNKIIRHEQDIVYLDLNKLKQEPEPLVKLAEILKPYNFIWTDLSNILSVEEEVSGKKIESPTHLLVKDRVQLVITKKSLIHYTALTIEADTKEIKTEYFHLSIGIDENKNFKIPTSKNIACLDLEKITFPLELRKWKEGDWFFPLGMNKKKKISDFLTDIKMPLNLKERVYVITSGDSIIWVVGQRVDNRFKITDKTVKVFLIKESSRQ